MTKYNIIENVVNVNHLRFGASCKYVNGFDNKLHKFQYISGIINRKFKNKTKK